MCSWTHPTFKFSQGLIEKYLFGWGRFKASSGPSKGTVRLTPHPIIATFVFIRRVGHRIGGISKLFLANLKKKLEWEKHATLKPDCKVCGQLFFIKVGWATTIIHSKKTH